MKYLRRDDNNGYREVAGEPLDTTGRPLRPWALTPSAWVVYDEWKAQASGLQGMFGLALGGMQSRTALRTYDKAASQTRRREFETELARDAGAHPECVKAAVDRVSAGIRTFVDNKADSAGSAVKLRLQRHRIRPDGYIVRGFGALELRRVGESLHRDGRG